LHGWSRAVSYDERMRSPARIAVALVVALLGALVATGVDAPAQAVDKQLVYGAINCPGLSRCPGIKMLWFDADWSYVGQQRANGGGYSIRLAPGTYYLQFVDQRPAWDTSKYAPTDIKVSVGERTVHKNVTMTPGAAITGVARAGGHALRYARVVAANKALQSFPTTADERGRFAIGGLPQGQYCLFTYDRAKTWVDKCTWAGAVAPRQIKNVPVRLTRKAGSLTVFVQTASGGSAPASTVTVTSKATGQWWTAKVRRGKAVLRGLYPGRYRIKYDAAGVWFTQGGSVHGAVVRSGRMAFGDFRLTKRGGWIRGSVIDGGSTGTYSLMPPYEGANGATITLRNAAGAKIASTYSDAHGNFKLDGQLATQSGLVIDVQPTEQSGGYMIGEMWCHFEGDSFPAEGSYDLIAGQETFVGDLALPRTDPDCG
jgi:hypothetical protein